MEELFTRISADIGDAALAASITAGLREVYASPPCGALELLLCRAVPESVARELLFTPSASSECGIGLYPQLIPSAPVGSGPEHPRRRLQPACLTLLALEHLRSWPLAAAFVREGGLRSLCGLLLDPNLHLRGQALDCFLQITSHPAYDWFAPPSGAEDDRALHSGVLALAQPVAGSATGAAAVPFLAALLQNWDCPGPGVSFNALQLLAWWLSFVRAIHTSPARPLQVSQALLQGLQRWAERPSGSTPGQSSTQEEAALAAKVHADFSRFAIPPAEEAAAAAAQEPAVKGLAALPASAAAAQTRAPSSELLREEGHATGEGLPAQAAPAPSAEAAAAACKEQGNAHFRGERWAEATAQYSAGIALLEGAPLTTTTTTTDALLALLSNRALSRLRGAGYGGGLLPHPSLPALLQAAVPAAQLRALLAQGSASGLAALLAAATQPAARAALAGLFGSLSDCERALALAPGHRKVLLRRAQVALVLGDGASALASARCAVAACGREGGGGDREALRSATAFLTHAIAAQAQAQGEEEEGEEEDSILSALLCRTEFGGEKGAQPVRHVQSRAGAGAGAAEGGGGEEREGGEGEQPGHSEHSLAEDVLRLCQAAPQKGAPLAAQASASSSTSSATTTASASKRAAGGGVSLDDVMSGRLQGGAAKPAGKRTFSLPGF